jgi:hypothetical protein
MLRVGQHGGFEYATLSSPTESTYTQLFFHGLACSDRSLRMFAVAGT